MGMFDSFISFLSDLGSYIGDIGSSAADAGAIADAAGGVAEVPLEGFGPVTAADTGFQTAGSTGGTFLNGLAKGAGSMLTGSILPQLATAGLAYGLNKMMGGHGPETQVVDARTPQQQQMNQAQLNTYQQLARDYTTGQHAMPLWDPVEQENIRRRTLAEAARSGVQDSGQAMSMVNRNLSSYRMGVAQQHEQNQIARAGQIAQTGMPGQTVVNRPAYNPVTLNPFSPPIPTQQNDTVGRDANGGQGVKMTNTAANKPSNPYDMAGAV